jgi:hypothetical protein
MFVLSRNVSASFRVIATLVATALIMATIGVTQFAQAANITNVYDLLSDSAPSADSNHTIQFKVPTAIAIGETIEIDFPAGFDFTGVTTNDFSVTAPDANWTEGVNTGTGVITLTRTTAPTAANATTTILINGTNKINNPGAVGSYEIAIAGTMTDSGYTRVAIVDTVEVTARVNTSFTFTVAGTGAGTSVNGETTNATSSTTTIPFGTLSAGSPVTLAQDLTVTTNAINGFVVTVEQDQDLLSSTGAVIDGFANASYTNSPSTWAGNPLAPDIDDPTSWGHWGLTSDDSDTDDSMRSGDEFDANEFIGVSTTPRAIFAHSGPTDGVTADKGATTIGYKVVISALQEAADDYSTTLTYIATPTF